MDEFQNKLIIREDKYEKGLYPRIPKFGKRGSAIILAGGCADDILVDNKTTTKQIRQGKYSIEVEVSTHPYIKELRFNSPSKETYFSFDVYVKAVIQVRDPITFYENRNLDVDTYFDNLLSLDVKKITRKYGILDYDGMDEELTDKLSAYNTVDHSTGFEYQISAVDAQPGENAQEYVRQYGEEQIRATLKEQASRLSQTYAKTYKDAIRREVAEGKISESEGILKIDEYNRLSFDEQTKRIQEAHSNGLITDVEAMKRTQPTLDKLVGKKQAQQKNSFDHNALEASGIDEFYTGEEEK